jgi:hypothetical protein
MRTAAIFVLTLTTAAIHLSYAALNFDGVMMLLSGLGYLALLGLMYLPIRAAQARHRLVCRTLIGYTVLVFIGYVVYGLVTGEWSVPLGPLAKAIEIGLIFLLVLDDRRDRVALSSAAPGVG